MMSDKYALLDTVILLVEDDPSLRETATDMLEEAGYRTVAVSDADEALAVLVDRHDIGTVFTDLDMPGTMNGLRLCEQVSSRWPRIRLVLTSGGHRLTDTDIPDRGRFVPKPYRRADVLRAILAAV